jgi:hypothetical protein
MFLIVFWRSVVHQRLFGVVRNIFRDVDDFADRTGVDADQEPVL